MLEATPGKPRSISFKDLLDVEHNMKWRLVRLYFCPRTAGLMRGTGEK